MIWLNIAAIFVALIAATTKLRNAWLTKSALETWVMALAIASLTVGLALNTARKMSESEIFVSRHAQVAVYISVTGAHFALMLFYYTFISDGRKARVRFEIALFLTAIGSVTALLLQMPGDGYLYYTAESLLSDYRVGLRGTIGYGYILYILAVQLVWTSWYAHRFYDRRLRTAIVIVTTGIVLLLIGVAYDLGHIISIAVFGYLGLPGHNYPPAVFILRLGDILIVGGIIYPIVASQLRRITRMPVDYRHFRQLEPLWLHVSQLFPEIIQPARPPSHRQAPRPWGRSWKLPHLISPRRLQAALELRLLQCQDGLACIHSQRGEGGWIETVLASPRSARSYDLASACLLSRELADQRGCTTAEPRSDN